MPRLDVTPLRCYALTVAVRRIPEWVEWYQTAVHPPPHVMFFTEDLHLFGLINEIQLAANVSGDLLEVGGGLAYSSVILGFMRRETESVTVVDPWESTVHLEENAREQDRYYRGVTLQDFTAHYRRFHDKLPDIRQGVSSEQLQQLPAGQYRFIHIDGSHEWSVVSGDVNQVLRILSPGGVVAFDDLFQRNCAGVGASVWPACATGDLLPIATTNKLYAMCGPSGDVSTASVARAVEADPQLRILGRHPIFGSDVLEITSPPSAPLLPRLRRYVPPVVLDVARASNLGRRVRRIVARPWRPGPRASGS